MTRDELLTALTTIRVSGGGGITASDVAREMIDYAGFALVPIEVTDEDRREWDNLDMFIASAEHRGKLKERKRCVDVALGMATVETLAVCNRIAEAIEKGE